MSLVVYAAATGLLATAQGAGNSYESFDSYANGSQIAGQGNWIYWADDTNDTSNGGAFVTNTFARSGANSLEVGAVGGIGSSTNSDVCWQFTSITNGVWTFRTMVYFPSSSTNGQQLINWMASHPATPDYIGPLTLDLNTGLVNGGPVAIVRDQWTEVRMEVRVDDLEYDLYYNDTPVTLNGTWDGPNQVEAIDLWADNMGAGVSPIYFDDLSMERMYISNADGATNVTGISAALNGELMLAVGTTTTVTVYWGLTDGGTDSGAWTNSISLGEQTVGPLTTNITGLAEDTMYYYRFFASGDGRDEWAHETASFRTLTAPTVDNQAPAFLAGGSARLRGTFADQNRGDVTFYWGSTDGGTDPGAWEHALSIGSQANAGFWGDVSGLIFPSSFYYTCYATNAYGDDWANSSTNFVTPDPGEPVGIPGSLNYAWYDNAANTELSAIDDGAANGQNGGLFALTPTPEADRPAAIQGKSSWTTEVWQGGNMEDTYCQMWWGYFLPPVSGTYTFYVHGDDYEALWIDTNGNGEYEAGTDLISDNTPPENWNTPHTQTVDLVTGIAYAIAVAHSEGTGGDFVNVTITPPGGSAVRIIPGDSSQENWWYSEIFSFSSVEIANAAPSDITTNSAALNGTLSCSASSYDVWLHWGTVDQTTNATLWANSVFLGTYTNEPGRSFSHTVTGLGTGSTNYFTFQASNALYSAWAAPSAEFLTVDGPPAVNNVAAITAVGSATLGGELTAGNAADVMLFWGRSDGGTNAAAWDSGLPFADFTQGSFSAEVAAGYGVTYYFRCYATNAAGEAWANASGSFVTKRPWIQSQLTAGMDFGVDAGLDTDGDQYWEDLVAGNPSGLGLLLDDSPAVNRVSAVTGTHLTHAYDFPGGSINNEAGAFLVYADSAGTASFQNAPGDWSNDPFSMEVWFKPDNLTPTPSNGQILFEDGGGTGFGLFIANNELVAAHDANVNKISYNLSTDPSGLLLGAATAEFIQVVVTHDTVTPFLTQLFINGQRVGTSNNNNDWSGGDAAAFGTRGANNVGGRGNGQANTESFDGQIALIRVYDGQILTADEVLANYHVVDPLPLPVAITNQLVSDVLENSATLNASLMATGWVFDVTAYWGATDGGTTPASWDHHMSLGSVTNHMGDLSYAASGLMGSSGYFYTFRATNAETNIWAAPSQYFETLGMPVVSNTAPTDVTQTSATLNGELVSGGAAEATIYWGLTDGGTTPGAWEHAAAVGTAINTIRATVPVIAGGTYHYRCYVTNAVGDDWADTTETFTAEPAQVSLGLAVNLPDLGLDPTTPTSSVPGCIFWIAADDIDGDGDTGDNPTNGAPVHIWADKSGLGHDVTRTGLVDPSLNAYGPNGRPVVTFQANDEYMATATNFDAYTEYTILSVARYTGGAYGRVISSASRNWLFGFHGGGVWEWHAEGWIYNGLRSDTDWHIHAGHINDEPDPQANFWVDGERLVVDDTGSGNANYMIGQLGLGGYVRNNPVTEESDCEIAEILIYDRVLTTEELNKVGLYLDNKYGLNTAYEPVTERRGTVTATATLSAPAISNVTVNLGFAGPNPSGLLHKGFHERDTDNYLDLNHNGGLMQLAPYGTAVLTDGPGGRGLDFNSDADFQATGAIAQGDYFANLFIGYFHPPVTGTYLFRINQDDDRAGIWLDLDQDGVFESSTPGLGSDRGEQLAWDTDHSAKAVDLVGGQRYMVAFTHREHTGASGCEFRINERVVKPSDPTQAGWWTYIMAPATHGSDYACVTSVTMPAGTVSTNVTITPIDDVEQEEDETAMLSIDSVVNAVIGTPANASFVISSRDPKVVNAEPSNVADSTAAVGGTLTMGDEATVTVYWGAIDGGTVPSSWNATNVVGYVVEDIPFSVDLTGLVAGQTYYYRCHASNDSNLGEDWADATSSFVTEGTSVSIDDVVVLEGDSGSVAAVFTVSLSAPSTGGVTVAYATLDGTATVAGGDYTATNGTLSIPAGTLSTQLTVMVNGDRLGEDRSETFAVELSNATGASLGNARGACTIEDDDLDVYLSGFAHRMPITFIGYTGSETLTNWPALLRLSEANVPGFSYASLASATGGDTRFVSADGTKLLSFEIESWNPAGESAIWVQVPELAGAGTRIWAYWGNPDAATLPTYATDGSMWDATFGGVWHMTETDARDSTPNGRDGLASGAPTPQDGQIDGSLNFVAGNSDFVTVTGYKGVLGSAARTASAWIKTTAVDADVLSWGTDSVSQKWIFRVQTGNGQAGAIRVEVNGGYNVGLTPVNDGQWHYVVATFADDGTPDVQDVLLYVDGAADGSSASLATAVNTLSGSDVRIGSGHQNHYFDGPIDEARVSSVARSADWIKACYENQKANSMFVMPGSIESQPVITIAAGATNIMANSAYATASLTSTGTAETTVWVHWGETDGGQTPANWANTRLMGTVTQPPPVTFTTNLVGLTSGTLYYYAYNASNSLGESWASSQFYTYGAPSLENAPATPHVGYATLSGNLLSTGGAPTTVFTYWGETDGGDNSSAWDHAITNGVLPVGTFSADTAAGLTFGQVYHYRTMATNANGTTWADTSSTFMTAYPMPPDPTRIAIYREATGLDEVADNGGLLIQDWDTTVREDASAYSLSGGSSILMTAGHHLVLYSSRFDEPTDRDSADDRLEVNSRLHLAGSELPIGQSQGYARLQNGDCELITAGGGIIEVANDNDALVLVSERTDTSGTDTRCSREPDASAIQLLKLGDSWDYCRLSRATDQPGPGDTTYIDVTYDHQDELDVGSFDHASGSGDIMLKAAGHYLVFANTYFQFDQGTDNRSQYEQRLTLDGNEVNGTLTTVYLRGNPNGNSCCDGATVIGTSIETVSPNQVLNVEVHKEGTFAETPTILAGRTAVTIMKLPDVGDYIRLGDSGTDAFNPSVGGMGWDDELEFDADGFTHNDSQVGAAVDDDFLFLTRLYDDNGSGQRVKWWQRWRVNGTTTNEWGHTGRYARESESESTGNGSAVLLNLAAGDYVEVISDQLGNTGTYQAKKKGLEGVRLSSIAPVPSAIVNLAASDVTTTSATFNASISASNAVYDVWVYWGETDGGEDTGQWTSSASLGTFTDVATNIDYSVSGLTPGTVYYYTFRVRNPAHDTWATPSVMIELPGPPVISDGWLGQIAAPTARLNGQFLTHTRGDVTICFGLTDGGTGSVDDWDHFVVLGAQTEADFSGVVNPLYHGQTYAFRCYATNAYGEDWSDAATTFSVELLPPRVPLEGLLGMWTFDDGTCRDVSGNGHDGIPSGSFYSSDVAPGATGQSIDLNGENFVLVDTGGNQDVFDVDRLTVSCWVKEWPDDTWEPYIGKNGEAAGWDLRRYSRGDAVDGDVDLTLRGTSGDDAYPHAGTSINADQQWHHLAATYDGSVAKLYFDNELIAQELHTGNISDTGSMLTFGARENSGGGTPNLSYFSSTKLDDVAIYDRGLTAEEIGELYARHTTPPVVNDPPTDVAPDSMQANATMTLSGGIYDLWVYWGATDGVHNPAAWTSKTFLGTVTSYVGSVSYTAPITAGITNYYTFRATNLYADLWGSPSIVVSPVAPPAVNNDTGAIVAIGSATLRGELTAGGYADLSIFWGRSDGGTNATAWDSVVSMADTPEGAFDTAVAAGHGVTYYYRCYVTNATGDAWAGATVSFETPAPIISEPDLAVTNGLLAHWDAASLSLNDGTQVDAWENSANPGTYDLTRMGGSPTYLKSVTELNGEPAVLFNDGGSDWFEFDDINTIRTVFWVLRDSYANADEQFLLGDDNVYHFHSGAGNRRIWHPTYTHDNIRSGSTELNGVVIDGINTDRLDDFAVISVVTTNGPVEASRVSYDRAIAGRSWEGEIAEILIYDQPLSSADEDKVGSYLSWKYGLSTAYPKWYDLDIANGPVSNVSTDSVTMNGMLNAEGWTFDIYACWGTNDGGTVIGNWDSSVMIGSVTNHVGPLSYDVTGLSVGPDYYCTFVAMNAVTNIGAGPSTGPFQVLSAPVVANLAATDVTGNSVTLNGDLVLGGSADITIYYGLSDGGTNAANWAESAAVGTRPAVPFANTVAVLAGGQYYYRCYATNELGSDWADSTTTFASTIAQLTVADVSAVEGDAIIMPPEYVPVLYEPFDYAVGNVSGNNGGTGFAAAWVATKSQPLVDAGSREWGDLPTAGNHARGNGWSGMTRGIGSALGDAGLMANGATLWFSVVMDLEGQNVANADINVALATDGFEPNTFGDRENLAAGEGIGVAHYRANIRGAYWQDTDADTIAERATGNSSRTLDVAGGDVRALIVGKIEWGADDLTGETLTLYAPDSSLEMGTPILDSWTTAPLDQSQFDLLAVQFKDQSKIDEVRFGPTYYAVVAKPPVPLVNGLVFNVSLSEACASNVTVNFATADGSATAGLDYTPTNGTLTIASGLSSASVVVPVRDDRLGEYPSESFTLNLSSPVNALIADGSATGTIIDDDFDQSLAMWRAKMKITFDGYTGAATLTNFPALVIFNEQIPEFLYADFASPTGGDLRFSDALGQQELNYEVEKWDPSGNSYVWVQVPELAPSNTYIWAYWKNPDQTNAPAYTMNGATWSEGFGGVWHMNAVNPQDSTANDNDGVGNNTLTLATGVAGDGLALDDPTPTGTAGDEDDIRVDDADSIDPLNFTATTWINTSWTGGTWFRNIMGTFGASGGENGGTFWGLGWMNPDDLGFVVRVGGSTNTTPVSGGALNDGTWHQLVGVRSGSDMKLYVDGSLANSGTRAGDQRNNEQLWFGNHGNYGTGITGTLDESRVSTVVRSDEWIRASYSNQVPGSAFATYDPVDVVRGMILIIR